MSYLPSLYTATQAIFSLGTITVCTAATLLYRYQRNLVYPSNFPSGSRTEVITPDHYDIDYENLSLKTPDGETLHAFLMTQENISDKEKSRGEIPGREETMKRRPTILFFHANAGNMGHRLPLAAVFYKKYGCNVFMLSYRGYGLSTGEASEKGIRIDAQTALDYIKNHEILKNTVIVLYGQSIGGAVAINLASRNSQSVHALILENTFLSIPLLIPHVLPLIRPFAFLCREYWHSEESIQKISSTIPILFLTGRRDELVPPFHMDTLMNNCKSKVRIRMVLKHGDHNDTCVQPGYFEAIGLFLAKYIIPRTSGGEAAASAAYSALPGIYTFANEKDSTGILDIISTTAISKENSQSQKHGILDSSEVNDQYHENFQRPSTASSSESEWIEMSARDADMASAVSVKPQDVI